MRKTSRFDDSLIYTMFFFTSHYYESTMTSHEGVSWKFYALQRNYTRMLFSVYKEEHSGIR